MCKSILTELATITGAAADIEAQEGRLDILINNAGITSSGDGSRQVQVSDCDNRSNCHDRR
jgi:NAD(P)-dependent dehydrogenase (short-subunit alcohol dehydrogenase family)